MKIAVGLSGGVDSAVAAALLRDSGHEVVGVTMSLGRADEADSLASAKRTAEFLNIPLSVVDLSESWRKEVLDNIRETSLRGETPNPCIRCNEKVKFGLLPRHAFDLGFDRFATGHYARLESHPEGIRLLRGRDHAKDQSYFLYRVNPDILARTLFPLGNLTKDEVKATARSLCLEAAERDESQDFCGGDPKALVGRDPEEGDIVDTSGKVLGRHNGFWNYTVGMRRGLGIGGGTPFYVMALDARRNRVIVGTREEALVRTFTLTETIRFPVQTREHLTVKVRSAGEPKGPVFWDDETTVTCPNGLSGVSPGQSAVFYAGETVVGGGIIAQTTEFMV